MVLYVLLQSLATLKSSLADALLPGHHIFLRLDHVEVMEAQMAPKRLVDLYNCRASRGILDQEPTISGGSVEWRRG